ncbi:hypothetical protein AB0O04_36650 [Streptomyces althioticus]|uniref:hypothetical protein n=1 Tax=Streptomyces althioticus TaxID=83380 RepID=UPI003416433D
MILRRYHDTAPDDGDQPDGTAPDGEQPDGTAPDTAEDAPQADKPAGRSRSRKTSKSGG